MDRIVEVKVNGTHVWKDSQYAGVQGEANATYLRIEFDEGWDGFTKTITWWDAKGENPTPRVMTSTDLDDITASSRIYLTPIVPEALAIWGKCMFSIDGYINGKRQRSAYASMVVKPRGNGEDITIEDVTPSLAEQLQLKVDAAEEQMADVCKGFDGTFYDTAGIAVREQVRDLHDRVNAVTDKPIDMRQSLFNGTLELIEGYTRSNTPIDLTAPKVVLDNPNPLYWMYPELIELKANTTYAFTKDNYFEGAIYNKLTGARSGYVSYAGKITYPWTEGDNCILYTTLSSDCWLVLSFHQDYRDVADFQVIEGDSLPEPVYLSECIKVEAAQVEGINQETTAAIAAVSSTAENAKTNAEAAIKKLNALTTDTEEIGPAVNLFDGTLELIEGYRAMSTTPIDLTNPQVPLDLADATHWIYPELIEVKQGKTYAFTGGHYLAGTLYKKNTGNKSGFLTHDNNSSVFTEGDNCLLYTTPATDADFWLALSFHQEYRNVADFQIVEGDSLPTETTGGIYLNEDIKVKAAQVEGVNRDTKAAIAASKAEVQVQMDEALSSIPKAPETAMYNFDVLQPIARKIQNVQSPTTLTLSLMTDTHYHDDDLDAEGKLATARLMGLLGDFAHVDFIGNLGDMVRGNEEVEVTRKAMAKLAVSTNQNAKCPVLFVRGNHDDNGWLSYEYGGTNKQNEILNDTEWYQAVFGIKTAGVVTDPSRPYGGYGYWDDEKSKVRVFLLNTSDIPYVLEANGSYRYNSYEAIAFSNEQLNFVANSLLFADKENPNEWAALFLSHIPLDTTNADTYRFGAKDHLARGHECLMAIIAAYRKGTSFKYSGSTYIASHGDVAADFDVSIDINYSDKGVGDVIGFICGHTHVDNFSRRVGYENSLSRNYAYIGFMGSTHFANIVIDRENSVIHFVKYGGAVVKTDDRTDLVGMVEDAPDTGSIKSGEWSVAFSQFRPNGENLYNGLSQVHATGVYPDNSSKVNLETLELDTAPQSGNYATSKAIPVKPFTRYAIPSNWNGLIRAFGDTGGGSSWLTPVAEDGYKVVTTNIRNCYLVFSHHIGSYSDYANFKIKEIYSGMEF